MVVDRDEIIINKSRYFLLPLYQFNSSINIINSYLGTTYSEFAFNNKLYVLCSKENSYISNSTYLVSKKDVHHGIMYELNIPKEFYHDYDNFLNGKYSKFSEKAKKIICTKSANQNNKKIHETDLYSILYRTEKKRIEIEEKLDVKLDKDAEYVSIFNEVNEIYG